MSGLGKDERETIITFNDAESLANIWSNSPSWVNKIKKLGGEPYGSGYSVNVPKNLIEIKKGK